MRLFDQDKAEMDAQPVFRTVFTLVLGMTVAISVYFRLRARRSGQVIPRHAERPELILLRVVFGLPLWAAFLGYAVYPPWMAWSQVALPEWLRWSGMGLAAATIPLTYSVFQSLGPNVSDTMLTKEGQRLVTWGPYRWVRHPLYSTACLALAALSVLAANWFMALTTAIVMAALPFLARREEAHLLEKFGSEYAEYMARTGRFLPRLQRPAGRSAGNVGPTSI
ncbi:MAG: isoprenylcysteine carboxylmethyltransferase family protein [Gemmatimonadetes bacterium]|nr:isoprenylcysteine carboxylmethyltransferase family protein [Gemmatimonadota bacterium]